MNYSARTAAEDDGLVRHVSGLLAAFLGYFKVRLQLVGLEGKQAGSHYMVIAGLALGALLLVCFGYFFFILGIVFLLAWAFGDGHAWIWVSLGMALLHFLVAVGLAWVAKNRFTLPMFEATLGEFRKDQEWLTSKTEKTH